MKKLTFLCLAITFLFTLNACSKIEDVKFDSTSFSDELIKDSNFKLLINQELALSERINTIILENSLSKTQLISQINKIIRKSKSPTELKDNLNTELSPMLYEFIIDFNKQNRKAWINLNQRFTNISENTIKNSCSKYFNQSTIIKLNNDTRIVANDIKLKSSASCGWGYNLCIAGVTAGAILCHAGCVGGTAGLGAPACVLLCGTMQVAAGAQCMSGYCNFNQ